MLNETAEELRARGIDTESVGEILDGQEPTPPPVGFTPARLEGTPPLPEPGIYFGMSDEEYHSLPALSNHGIKYLSASPMLFWSRTPWLSPKKQKQVADAAGEEKLHHTIGKAYHCRIMEGPAEFARRFVVELDPADYPDALVSTEQIKAAIGRHECLQPVKPCSARREELQEQLRGLIANAAAPGCHDEAVLADMKVDALKAMIREFRETVPVKPVVKVDDELPDGTPYQRPAVKADWINQLLELDPEAQVFDRLQADFLAEHDGKAVVSLDVWEQLEIAAAMVERDPEVREVFRDGYAEVVLIWNCPKTGVPMKAKLDYLKLDEIADLKTVANQRDRSIEQAIRWEIGGYHYNFQPVVYFEAVEQVRKVVHQLGASAVHSCDIFDGARPCDEDMHHERVTFALKWAKSVAPVEFIWVFQQKGDAPITRGVRFPRTGIVHGDTELLIDRAKRKFIQHSEVFGTEPWLDIQPIYTIADEDIPRSATEI